MVKYFLFKKDTIEWWIGLVIEERVNRLVEEIKRFCERVGGKVKHVKTVHTHHISCIFDRERKVSVDYLGDMDLMLITVCLLYTSPSPRDLSTSRMPSSA